MNAWNNQTPSELSRIEQVARELGRGFIVTFETDGGSPIRQQPHFDDPLNAYAYGLRIAQQWQGVRQYRVEVAPPSGYSVGLPRSPGI